MTWASARDLHRRCIHYYNELFLLIIFLITITRGQCNNLFIALYKLDDHLATGYKE